jgi:Ca2+-binding EF-hand superfamily protein
MNKRGEWTKSLYNQDPSGKQDAGIKITREEVEAAFNFFDVSGRGVLRPKDLKARLSAFYPNMTNKEYRFLISEPNFTVETLWQLLSNNNISNFDPVKEAFKVYDPHDTGYVDPEVLKGIMARMGYGEMTKDDMEVLIKTADVDADGKISLEDFRNMLNFNKYPKSSPGGPSASYGDANTSSDEDDDK